MTAKVATISAGVDHNACSARRAAAIASAAARRSLLTRASPPWSRRCVAAALTATGARPEEGRLVAALLAAGEGALLSHGTAAWRWRIIPAPPSVMQLAVPQPRTAPAGVMFHQSGRLRAGRRHHQRRLPGHHRRPAPSSTSRPATTTARCCARSPKPSSSTTSPGGHRAHAAPGHPGSANLRAALKAHAPGHGDMKSQLERRFRRLLIARGIELPLRNEQPSARGPSTACGPAAASGELDGRQHQRQRQADQTRPRLWLRRHGDVSAA